MIGELLQLRMTLGPSLMSSSGMVFTTKEASLHVLNASQPKV
jgi:hypothetical protein